MSIAEPTGCNWSLLRGGWESGSQRKCSIDERRINQGNSTKKKVGLNLGFVAVFFANIYFTNMVGPGTKALGQKDWFHLISANLLNFY